MKQVVYVIVTVVEKRLWEVIFFLNYAFKPNYFFSKQFLMIHSVQYS